MQNTIHFLISHSISLYCQTEREGLEGTDRDVGGEGEKGERVRGADEKESRRPEWWKDGWRMKKKAEKKEKIRAERRNT